VATNDTGDWRELFDVALFEPSRVKLRQRIEHARDAIHSRLDALTDDQHEAGRMTAERIALRDALTTLTELHQIVYARKESARASGRDGRAAG
jgi:hypothetical protein